MGQEQHEIVDRYRLLERIGKGGSGVVWRAQDLLLQREVAMKEISPPTNLDEDDRRRLQNAVLREARASARLHHPGAVSVFDVVEEGQRQFIVMELVQAADLSQVVASRGPLGPQRTARIGLELLDVLRAAHQSGIVHRDVKSGNVLVPTVGRCRLSDFGIASLMDDPSITATGMIKGTPSYMSPEQALGAALGPATDMWSLGATLYFAVEGHAPFDKRDPIPTLAAIALEDPQGFVRAGSLGPVLQPLFAKDPAGRPDYEALRRSLRSVASQDESPAGSFSRAGPSALRLGRTDSLADRPSGAPRPGADIEAPLTEIRAPVAAGPGAVGNASDSPASAIPDEPSSAERPERTAVAWPGQAPRSAAQGAPRSAAQGAPRSATQSTTQSDASLATSSFRPPGAHGPSSVSGATVAARSASRAPAGDGLRAARTPPPRTPSDHRPGVRSWGIVALASTVVFAGGVVAMQLQRGASRPTPSRGALAAGPIPTTGHSTTSPPQSNTTEAAAPGDWKRYTDPATGFILAYPPTWTIERRETLTDFRDPASGTYLRIDHQSPPATTPDGPWYSLEPRFAAANPGYQRIGITRTNFHGYPAAVWEYTYQSGSTRLHAIDMGMIVGDRGFGFNFQSTDTAWSQLSPLLNSLEASFQP